MGSIILTIPDIPDASLIYNESETRAILKFFWPTSGAVIDGCDITNPVRSFAQTLLVAAIDGSYAMGYVHATFDLIQYGITRQNTSITALARRLARNFIRHWWRHTRQQDLETARIYESVRATIALQHRDRFESFISGLARAPGHTTIVLARLATRGA